MHRIEPARWKPGVRPEDLPRPRDAAPEGVETHILRGQTLIFWNPAVPGAKRDAIMANLPAVAEDE